MKKNRFTIHGKAVLDFLPKVDPNQATAGEPDLEGSRQPLGRKSGAA